MMPRPHLLLVLVLSLAAAWAQAAPPETICAGNGALTMGIDPHGRVTFCRWPSPGYFNQLRYGPGGQSPGGAAWGVKVGDRLSWVAAEPWKTRVQAGAPLVEVVGTMLDPVMTVTQSFVVHNERNVFAARVTFQAVTQPVSSVYWYANFSPCTRLVPELPLADLPWDAWNDFAAFSPDAGKTVVHFRPANPGAADWARARELAARPVNAADWAEFGPGTWIAYTSPNAVSGFQCGTDTNRTSAFRQAGQGALSRRQAAVGPCDSAVELAPDGEGHAGGATVFCAFGNTLAEVQADLAWAVEQGFEGMTVQATLHWRQWLGQARVPATLDKDLAERCQADLVTLAVAADRATGAIVQSPLPQPPLALDWPRQGAWITLALDQAGYHDLAGKHCQFYADAVRTRGKRGMPAGSMAAASYANGIDGAPHVVLDAAVPSWMLASCWRHAGALDPTARAGFLEQAWKPAILAADFVAGWTDDRNREPFFSFDAEARKDRQSVQLLLETYMGVDAALRLANVAGFKNTETWQQRKRQLDALVRFHCIDEVGAWRTETLPFGIEAFAKPELPSWDPVMDRRVKAMTPGQTAANDIAEVALVWRGRPEKLGPLRPLLGQAPRPGYPDALEAAQHFLAASIIYGG